MAGSSHTGLDILPVSSTSAHKIHPEQLEDSMYGISVTVDKGVQIKISQSDSEEL